MTSLWDKFEQWWRSDHEAEAVVVSGELPTEWGTIVRIAPFLEEELRQARIGLHLRSRGVERRIVYAEVAELLLKAVRIWRGLEGDEAECLEAAPDTKHWADEARDWRGGRQPEEKPAYPQQGRGEVTFVADPDAVPPAENGGDNWWSEDVK